MRGRLDQLSIDRLTVNYTSKQLIDRSLAKLLLCRIRMYYRPPIFSEPDKLLGELIINCHPLLCIKILTGAEDCATPSTLNSWLRALLKRKRRAELPVDTKPAATKLATAKTRIVQPPTTSKPAAAPMLNLNTCAGRKNSNGISERALKLHSLN